MKINTEMIVMAYEYAKKVYSKQIEKRKAIDVLNSKVAMNKGSANDYLTVFCNMMQGKEYHITSLLIYYPNNILLHFR